MSSTRNKNSIGDYQHEIRSYTNASNYMTYEQSTNLVNPKKHVQPKVHDIKSLNMIDRLSMVIPEPLVVEKNQRPYPKN